MDPVTKIQNYGFRHYSPQNKRWMTVDPIRSGLNWYVYVNNNPINLIDPWGLDDQSVFFTPEDGTSYTEGDYNWQNEIDAEAFGDYVENLPPPPSNQQVGTFVMFVGGVGIFMGGNIPAAYLMAAGAILYTTPDSDPNSDIMIVADAIADFATPPHYTAITIITENDSETDGGSPCKND
jgi:hypothetical protein